MDAEPALLFFGIFGRGGIGDLLQTTIQSLWPLTSILPSELDILENDCGTSCGVAYENSTWLDPIGKKKKNNKNPKTMIRFEKGKEMTRCVFMSGRSEVFPQWSAWRHLLGSQMAAVKCDYNVIIKTNFPHQRLRFVIKFNCSSVRHQQRGRKRQTELCLQRRKRFPPFCGAYVRKCLTWSNWNLFFFFF